MVYKFRMDLTTRTIAALLGVTDRRVRDIAKELRLKPARVGATMLFSESDLNKMKQRNTKPGVKPKRNGARK